MEFQDVKQHIFLLPKVSKKIQKNHKPQNMLGLGCWGFGIFRPRRLRVDGKSGWVIAWVTCAIYLFLEVSNVAAQGKGLGLGFIVGEPTGISGKKWLSSFTAFDFAAAWSFRHENSMTLHADILSHNFNLLPSPQGNLPFYYGIGGRVKFNHDDPRLGVRFPLGLNYHFIDVTIDAFIEIVPILELLPDTEFELNAAIGIRYFF